MLMDIIKKTKRINEIILKEDKIMTIIWRKIKLSKKSKITNNERNKEKVVNFKKFIIINIKIRII